MNKFLSLLLLSIFSFHLSAQESLKFETGYFIDNSGDTTFALIKNVNWINNPSDFEYKLNDSSKVLTRGISSTKEFGISYLKYVRFNGFIDRSSEDLNSLTEFSKPYLKEETLFLEVLLEGEATLYKFKDRNNTKFFFRKNNKDIQPLTFKIYLLRSENRVRENVLFKQQLLTELPCSFPQNKFLDLSYTERSLTQFFKDYNQCVESEFIFYSDLKPKSDLLNVNPKFSFKLDQLSSELRNGSKHTLNTFGFEAGLEFEFLFYGKPYSIILNPSLAFSGDKSSELQVTENAFGIIRYSYKSFDLGILFRNYFFIKEKKKFFAQAGLDLGLSIDSKVKIGRPRFNQEAVYEFEKPKIQPTIGIGYLVKEGIAFMLEASTKTTLYNNILDVTPPSFIMDSTFNLDKVNYQFFSLNIVFGF